MKLRRQLPYHQGRTRKTLAFDILSSDSRLDSESEGATMDRRRFLGIVGVGALHRFDLPELSAGLRASPNAASPSGETKAYGSGYFATPGGTHLLQPDAGTLSSRSPTRKPRECARSRSMVLRSRYGTWAKESVLPAKALPPNHYAGRSHSPGGAIDFGDNKRPALSFQKTERRGRGSLTNPDSRTRRRPARACFPIRLQSLPGACAF
jgi:hypothetical protein